MHRIGLKLNRINQGQGLAVPIHITQNESLFTLNGSLTAEIEGDPNTTNISWVQTLGSPVTFTSPTNQLKITFTTTDLFTKTFICYTNEGTNYERSDTGSLFHHPIDVIISEGVDTTSKSHVIDSSFPIAKGKVLDLYPGMMAYDSKDSTNVDNTPNSVIRSPDDNYDNYIELVTQGANQAFIDSVLVSKLQVSIGGGSFNTVQTYQKYRERFVGIDNLEGNNYKVIYSIYYYGNSVDIELNDTQPNSDKNNRIGFSNRLTNDGNTEQSKIGVSNYKFSLSSIKDFTLLETFSNTSIDNNSRSLVSNYNFIIQSKKSLSLQESITVSEITSSSLHSIKNYTFQLQTSTGVT